MSIIYLKNPRSGSHFRFITGQRRQDPKTKGKKSGRGSVAWASCSFKGVSDPVFPQFHMTGQRRWHADPHGTLVMGAIFALLGIRDPRYHGAPVQFSKPCR